MSRRSYFQMHVFQALENLPQQHPNHVRLLLQYASFDQLLQGITFTIFHLNILSAFFRWN